MNIRLSPLQGRIAALALLLLVLLLAYLALVRPMLARYHDNQARIGMLEQRLDGYRRQAAQAPVIKAQLERAIHRLDQAGYFLKSTTTSLASAELQELVRARIKTAGAHLLSSQAHEAALFGGRRRAEVDARMQGDVNSLRRVLFALASSRPMVFVDELVVTAIRGRVVGRVKRDNNNNRQQVLDIRIKASAYMKKEPAGA